MSVFVTFVLRNTPSIAFITALSEIKYAMRSSVSFDVDTSPVPPTFLLVTYVSYSSFGGNAARTSPYLPISVLFFLCVAITVSIANILSPHEKL